MQDQVRFWVLESIHLFYISYRSETVPLMKVVHTTPMYVRISSILPDGSGGDKYETSYNYY